MDLEPIAARQEPRPAGRARLLPSPIFGPLPFHPWPQNPLALGESAVPVPRLLLRPRGKAAFDFSAPRRARAEKVEQRQFQRLVGGKTMVFDAEIVAGRADPVVMGGELFQVVLSRGGRIDIEVAPGLQ